MGKEKKLSLNVIKVQSFVTSLDDGQQEEVKGGGDSGTCPSGQYSGCPCGTAYTDCNQYSCTCLSLCLKNSCLVTCT